MPLDDAEGEGLELLIRDALPLWGVEADVQSSAAMEVLLRTGDGMEVRIDHGEGDRAAGRWRVSVRAAAEDAARESHHAGITGMLRAVRLALAPGLAAGRLRIATQDFDV